MSASLKSSKTSTTLACLGTATFLLTCFLFFFRQAEWWYIEPGGPPASIRHCDIKLTIWKPRDLIPYAEWRGLWVRRGGMWSEALAEHSLSVMGVEYIKFGDPRDGVLILVPTWPIITAGLLLTALGVYPTARRFLSHRAAYRRTAANRCAKCSYDLRAHHPGDKCPECGTLIPDHPPSTHPKSDG